VHRREGELVELYEQHLDELEIEHGRLEMPVEDTKLYNDIYVPDRHQLIEAKGGVRREHIRMAIGQLADYAFRCRKTRVLNVRRVRQSFSLNAQAVPSRSWTRRASRRRLHLA
jgi:hypothetical protein